MEKYSEAVLDFKVEKNLEENELLMLAEHLIQTAASQVGSEFLLFSKYCNSEGKNTFGLYPNTHKFIEKQENDLFLLIGYGQQNNNNLEDLIKNYYFTKNLNLEALRLFLNIKSMNNLPIIVIPISHSIINAELPFNTLRINIIANSKNINCLEEIALKQTKAKFYKQEDAELDKLLFEDSNIERSQSPQKIKPNEIAEKIIRLSERHAIDRQREILEIRKLYNDLLQEIDSNSKRQIDIHPSNLIIESAILAAKVKEADSNMVSPRARNNANLLQQAISSPRPSVSQSSLLFKIEKIRNKNPDIFEQVINGL